MKAQKMIFIGGMLILLAGIGGWIYGSYLADKIEREECYHESMMEPNNCK